MTNTKYVSLTNLHAAERRVEQELAFTATCKNDGRTRTWDFKKKSYADSQRPILEIFVWSLYKLRNKHGNKTTKHRLQKQSKPRSPIQHQRLTTCVMMCQDCRNRKQ